MKQLATESIINSGKKWQSDSFFEWIQSWFFVPSTNEAPKKDCSKCSCGQSNSNRILGGDETGVNQYPWMAIILFNNEYKCGASLINDQYVLTLSGCTFQPIKNITVRLLEHDRSIDTETKLIDRQVQSIVMPPDDGTFRYSNVALVKFTERVALDGVLNPVCLPTPGLSYDGFKGLITGWGSTQKDK